MRYLLIFSILALMLVVVKVQTDAGQLGNTAVSDVPECPPGTMYYSALPGGSSQGGVCLSIKMLKQAAGKADD